MALANRHAPFEKDIRAAKDSFPKLDYFWNRKAKSWVVSGELDICDVKGNYWNTFDISIVVPESYPYCVPLVLERSNIIPRHIDWHISDQGLCCLDSDNALLAMSRRGIHIENFIRDKVYPFFANQLFKLSESVYAGSEYRHHTDGIIQYYIEELNIPSVGHIVIFLDMILNRKDLTRNRLCPCESGEKIKKCHEKAIETIKSLGREKITSDLNGIKKLSLKEQNS